MDQRPPGPLTPDRKRNLQARFHTVMAVVMLALPVPIYGVALTNGAWPSGHPWSLGFFLSMGLAHLTAARAKRREVEPGGLQYLFLGLATVCALTWLRMVKGPG